MASLRFDAWGPDKHGKPGNTFTALLAICRGEGGCGVPVRNTEVDRLAHQRFHDQAMSKGGHE